MSFATELQRPRTLWVAPLPGLLAALVAACSEDAISRPRADSGVSPRDGGGEEPLLLTPGMAFTYRAILTYRDAMLGAERNSQYTFTLTIDAANDRGRAGESTVDFSASSFTTTADDWTDTADFDSWVARLGPARRDDRVSAEPVTAHLEEVPVIPPPPPPKVIPSGGTFFLDMRKIEKIRADFASAYTARSPQVVDPSMNQGRWRLSFMGVDDTIFYYPPRAKTRRVQLHYDPRGFLTRMEETIGDSSMAPSADTRLELVSGP